MKQHRGLSLVELLVVLSLGTIVLGSVLRMFVAGQDVYRVQEDAARVQENLRFTMDQLATAVRQAAFLGGASLDEIHNSLTTSPTDAPCSSAWSANPANGLRGLEGATQSPATICTVGRYVAQSDILVATFADPDAMLTPSQYGSSADFAAGNLFLRALAGGPGFIFDGAGNRPTAVDAIPGSDTDGITEYRIRTIAYSLGAFQGARDPSPTPTLYVCDSASHCGTRAHPQPLIEGVEQLQLDFGIDQDGDRVAERFLAASDIAIDAWPSVVAARIGLVARGARLDPFGEARDFPMPGSFRHRPADDPRTAIDERRLVRRALVQTVQIRNRVRR